MNRLISLDSNVLGLVANPQLSPETYACNEWLELLLKSGHIVVAPEIADYEVRRELVRANKLRGLRKLDGLKMSLLYVPINTEAMLLAAQLWAQVRRMGRATADNHSIDADVILAAQSLITAEKLNLDLTIATTNVRHLGRLAPAKDWRRWS
jgi:predicted nucleic acid-binding protein